MKKEQEFKVVVMSDEEGNEIHLKVIREIEHNGKKYVILDDQHLYSEEDGCCGHDCHCHDEDEEDDEDDDYEDEEDDEDDDKKDKDHDKKHKHEDEDDEEDDEDYEDEEDEYNEDDEYAGGIYVFEVVENEEGNEEYREIDYETIEELLPVIEKELYPSNE